MPFRDSLGLFFLLCLFRRPIFLLFGLFFFLFFLFFSLVRTALPSNLSISFSGITLFTRDLALSLSVFLDRALTFVLPSSSKAWTTPPPCTPVAPSTTASGISANNKYYGFQTTI